MAKDDLHWFDYGETLWNERRKASEWHFDPAVKSEPKDNVNINFIKFRGDWKQELEQTKFEEDAPMDLSQYLLRIGIQEHVNLGIDTTKIYGKRATVTPDIHKKITKIIDTFQLEKPYAQIMYQKPGNMHTLHIDAICHDNFGRNKVTSIDEVNFDDTRSRVFVALEDWQWGQFMMMGNHQWVQWKAGDVMWFKWQDIPHATANAGHRARPMLKITGKTTPEFEALLKEDGKVFNV